MKALDGQGRRDLRADRHLRSRLRAALRRRDGRRRSAPSHILVNNAALYYDIDNFDPSFEYLQKVIAVNQHGAWLMARAAAPVMAKQHYGRIINQSSGAAYAYMFPPFGDEFTGLGNYSYSITKWGIVGLTKFMAAQLGSWNITVNCIAPGVTMTEATKKIVPDMFIQGMTAHDRDEEHARARGPRRRVRVLRQRRRQVRDRPDPRRSTAAWRCPPDTANRRECGAEPRAHAGSSGYARARISPWRTANQPSGSAAQRRQRVGHRRGARRAVRGADLDGLRRRSRTR